MTPLLTLTLTLIARLLAALALLGGAGLRAQPAAGEFTLPAGYAGVLPCADCAGIAVTLTLREDGLYRLRRTYLGKPGAPFNEIGRWAAETSSGRLLLRSGSLRTVFELPDAATLRQLDGQGRPIPSDHKESRQNKVSNFNDRSGAVRSSNRREICDA